MSKKEKLYVLPNGDAVLKSSITKVVADSGCGDLLPSAVLVYSPDILRIETNSFALAIEWRDKIVNDVNQEDTPCK